MMMLKLITLIAHLQATAHTRLAWHRSRRCDARDERGSLTMEQALWAAAVIVLVGIVYAVFKSFINSTVANIK